MTNATVDAAYLAGGYNASVSQIGSSVSGSSSYIEPNYGGNLIEFAAASSGNVNIQCTNSSDYGASAAGSFQNLGFAHSGNALSLPTALTNEHQAIGAVMTTKYQVEAIVALMSASTSSYCLASR
jgi:hypothetical protein